MSLYDDASLIMFPSGYKEDKIYSLKPTDGSGDLTFTRASSATRVNADGLIEGVRTNTFLYSEDFSDATWVKERISVSSNVTTAPDGTSTADKIVENTDNNSHRARQNANSTQGLEYTLSYYLKASERTKARIAAGGLNASADFDLSTGVIIGSPTLCTASITNVGSGWYRCAITYTQTSVTSAVQLNLVATLNAAGDFIYTGDGTSGIFVWGAMLETGVLTDYIPTTTTAVSVGMLANVPRIDYTGGGCGKLILEPQRTNLLTYSEQFDNAAWTKDGSTATANAATSPDGTSNADKLFETATTDFHRVFGSTISVTSGTAYTASIFVKAAEVTTFAIELRLTASVGTATFNLVAETATNGGIIQDYGNGWYRCIFTATATATGNGRPFFYIKQSSSYAGNASNGILIYGASLEAGSYATSYIPTTSGTAVTRLADAVSKTGISDKIGQTEGTVFLEVDYSNLSGLDMFLSIRPNSSNKVEIYRDGANIFGELTAASITFFSFSATKAIGRHKIALAYKSGSSALYIDGALVNQNTTAFSFSATLADLFLNQRSGGTFIEAANFNQAQLYTTRLTNAELATLTTL
jgi:hypothetical protein